MTLIDTHQHLILRGGIGYGWTAGLPALATGDFTPSDYAALTAGRGVTATIFMETGVDDASYHSEARHVAGLVGQNGLLGQIASIRPEEDAGFDDWLAEGDSLHVLGYRRILHEVDDALSQGEVFRRNLKKIGARDLPFDLVFLARQLGLADDLLRACPDQVFVLDHCGVPDIAAGAFSPWADSITRLARHPNLYLKLSGITRYCAPGMATLPILRPWVDHVLAAFGPARMMWGSDWPVVNLGVGLPEWLDMTHAILADLSADEAAAISRGTALKVYRP